MQNNIICFPRKSCAVCKGHFIPKRSWHRACRQCWAWHKALAGIEQTRRALKGVW